MINRKNNANCGRNANFGLATWLASFGLLVSISYGQEITGSPRAISTTKAVAGNVSGSIIQNAWSGKDFHIIADNLPLDETLQLELGFAELEFSALGSRTFDLTVNDKPALNNFDIIQEAGGPLKSVTKKFTITPPGGQLDFHFTSEHAEAAVNYIRIQGKGLDKLISISGKSGTAPIGQVPDELQVPPDQQATYDVESGIIHLDESVKTWANGVPLGGIGTGKFEILPNGQFANFTINNSWDLPVLRPRGTFLAVAAKASSRGGTARLLQVAPVDADGKTIFSDHTAMKEADFNGQFPFANLDFKDEKFPLKVTVNSWSPLVPYSLEDSSIPGAIVNVVLENSKNYPVAAAVAFSWEDLNGRGGSLLPGDQHGFTGRATHQDAATSSITGFQINTDYNQNNRLATFTGNYFVGSPIKGAAVSRKLSWNPRTGSIPWWKQFSSKLRLDKIPSSPATITSDPKAGPMASTLCVSFNLAPNEVRRVPFVVGWYFPKIVTMDPAGGDPSVETLDYSERFGSSSGVASYLASNRVSLRESTDDWFDLISRSTIPKWLKAHGLNSLFPIKSNSILLQNHRFAMLEAPGDMKGMLGPIDLRMASSDFLRSFYPDLEKRELNLFARAQNSTGEIPRYVGNIHGALAGFDTHLLGQGWVGPTANWILQVASYWRETGDQEFIDSLKPTLVKARTYLIENLKKSETESNAFSVTDSYTDAGRSTLVNGLAAIRAADGLAGTDGSELQGLLSQYADQMNPAETTSTFAAALSGESALQAAALPGFLSASDIQEYLKMIQKNNFQTKPVPSMESGATGIQPDGLFSFPAVLQAYVGPLAISAGMTDFGLDPYIRMFQVAYAAQKNPWKQALRYDVPAGANATVRYHRTSMAAWSFWRALSGVVHDIPNNRLYLNPHNAISSNSEMEIPVFTPAFRGWLKYYQADSTGTLSIVYTNPDITTQTITSVAKKLSPDGSPESLITFATPFVLEEGATLQLDGWPVKPSGTITPQEPPDIPEALLQLDDLETTGNEAVTTKTNEVTTPEIEQGEEMPPTPEPESLE